MKRISDQKTIVHNPVIPMDFPDPDVLRVGDTFYMTTTSTHFCPSVPIMRSKDLKHWEIISYVTDVVEDNETHRLENGKNGYGSGVWATTLRYHKGKYYVMFNCNEERNTYIYSSDDIEKGPWKKSVLKGMHHDLSLLFDDNDRVYIVYGGGTIHITELTEDAAAVKPGGVDQILVDTPHIEGLNCEGSHFYKINGVYYLFMINWPSDGTKRRLEWCYRCDSLLGKYEGRLLMDSAMGYYNNGVAQGGIFDTPDGQWFAMLFQDRYSAGRFPVLLPVTWKDGWPVMGTKEKEADIEVEVPLSPVETKIPLYRSDDFDGGQNALGPHWQWNHNPACENWSLQERIGWIRLYNRIPAPDLESARNTLTQRLPYPWCACEAKMDVSGLEAGDLAGIAAFQANYGYMGARAKADGTCSVVFGISDGKRNVTEREIGPVQDILYLRIVFDFRNGEEQARDLAFFAYSLDGINWEEMNVALRMKYTLDHFSGYRIALFSYNTKDSEGHADFDYLKMKEE